MKKIILIATCAATISAYAIPTYEPFTEYSAAVAATGTNSIDLATGGFSVTTGATVEQWTSLNFSATGTSGGHAAAAGWDIQVTNFTSSVFTASAMSTLLPSGFPGAASTITLCAFLPYNTQNTNNSIGNSAVLNFSQDITRPASGTSTIFVSYLLDIAAVGSTGPGNNGRYCEFLAQSNLVEGTGTSGFYTTGASLFNTFSTTSGPKYVSYGVKGSFTGGGDWILASDTANGNYPSTEVAGIGTAYNKAAFVVGAFVFTTGGATKDTNLLWVNPSTTAFGGPNATAIAACPYVYTMTNIAMSDVAGFNLEDRPGGGWTGGVGPMYIGNLILGTTWSYVTGGPEFTNQPAATTVTSPGANVTLGAVAVAAGQTVTYQWTLNGVNVTNGANGTGGGATVVGATLPSLTLNGVSAGDAGSYAAVATASGTGFTLASSNALVVVSDPGVITSPSPATANAGGTASFTAQVETTSTKLTYAWYHGAAMLTNGLQADGSTASGAQGTNGGGTSTLTLTLTNVVCADDGSYTLFVTNLSGSSASTVPASLTVTDPYITVQPPATAEISATDPNPITTIAVTAAGTGLTYQWNIPGGANGNGEITGLTLSTLTIANANSTSADAGTYSVVVSGSCGSPVTSANTIVYYDTTAPSGASVFPPALTQQTGTHLALIGTVTNTGNINGLVNFVWTFNNGTSTTTLANGTKADGSWVSGVGAQFICTSDPFVQSSPLVLSNLQVTDSGTYTLIASNAAGTVASLPSSVVTVTPKFLALAPTNLIVIRVGDGAEPLSGATGNTLYLDQIATNGAYVSTIMVPDYGPSAMVVAGAGVEGPQEGYLTLSSNQEYLNFGGFCYNYPYLGGSDVTAGGTTNVRGIYALNASGVIAEVYTNYGLYSGAHGFRDVFSTDGLTNFWTTGSASGGTIKYVNAGPAGAAYTITTPGQGIPALSADNTGGVSLGLYFSNLVFSVNKADENTNFPYGLNQFVGAPEATDQALTATTQILTGGVSYPTDFAFSPDGNTAYVADDDQTSGNSGNGGIQRWDLVSGAFQYSYNLYDSTSGLAPSTNGCKGLTVYFPPQTYGFGVTGAILYATTSEALNNRIITFTDTGAGSTASVVATAATNQFYHGIRFGPQQAPLNVSPMANQIVSVGAPVSFSTVVSGAAMSYYFPNAAGNGYNLIDAAPISYQWSTNGTPIPGATNSVYSIASAQGTNSGTYKITASTGLTTNSTSATLFVDTGAPLIVTNPASLMLPVGGTAVFTVVAVGAPTLTYHWMSNNMALTDIGQVSGSLSSALTIANCATNDSASYSVMVANGFSPAATSTRSNTRCHFD